MIDLASLVKESISVAGQQADFGAQALETASALQDVAETKAANAARTAQAEADVVRIKLSDAARQEAARKEIAVRLGTDPTVAGSVIERNFNAIKEADAGMAAAAERIRQKDSISLIDNPLGYLIARATVNEDIANHNFFVDQKNRAEATNTAAAKATTDMFAHSNALTAVNTEAFITASTIIAAHKGNVEAAEAAVQGLRWNLEGMQLAAGASRDRLQTLYSANSAIMQDKQFRLSVDTIAWRLRHLTLTKLLSKRSWMRNRTLLRLSLKVL